MKQYRLIPYRVAELPKGVNGRHPHMLAPYFVLSPRVSGDEAERVKLHEWIHVVLSALLFWPAIIVGLLCAHLDLSLWWIAPTLPGVAIVLLRRLWPSWLLVEWEAIPKGAEVAAGGSLKQEAEGLAWSSSYKHGRSLRYCSARIAWWAARLGWLT